MYHVPSSCRPFQESFVYLAQSNSSNRSHGLRLSRFEVSAVITEKKKIGIRRLYL